MSCPADRLTCTLGPCALHGGVPSTGLPAGLLEDLCAQGDDQAGVLGHGDELVVGIVGLRPPGERFDGDDAPGDEVGARLEVHGDLVAIDGRVQPVGQGDPPFGALPEDLVVDLDPGPAFLLGPVHGRVGLAQQRRRA